MRVGHGFDVHRFDTCGSLVIGGVEIKSEHRMLSYSDGDVVLHATIDALLGASGCGDIGTLFPNTDPKFKKADSKKFLCEVWKKVLNKGYFLGNLDITIIAQKPKMQIYIQKMRFNISKILNCNINDINIKATTTEYLGVIGKGKAIACEAITLLLHK